MGNDNNDAALVLLGGLALLGGYYYLSQQDAKKDDDPFGDEGWSKAKDVQWAEMGRLQTEFQEWDQDYEGEVVQAVEKARALMTTVAESIRNENWPIQDPLATRIGNCQSELIRVITLYKGKAGNFARSTDSYAAQYLQSANFRALHEFKGIFDAAMHDSMVRVKELMERANVINNYQQNVQNFMDNRTDNRSVVFNQQQVNNHQENKFLQQDNRQVLLQPGLPQLQANQRPPVRSITGDAAPLMITGNNRDAEVDNSQSKALVAIQPGNANALPMGQPGPVSQLALPPAEGFEQAPPPKKRRKTKSKKKPKPKPQPGPESPIIDMTVSDDEDAAPPIHDIGDLPPPMFPRGPEDSGEGFFNSAPKTTNAPQDNKKRQRPDPPEEFNQAHIDEEVPKKPIPEISYIERINVARDRFNQLALSPSPDKAKVKAQAQMLAELYPGGDTMGTFTNPKGEQKHVKSFKTWSYGIKWAIEGVEAFRNFSPENRRVVKGMADSPEMKYFIKVRSAVGAACKKLGLNL